MNKKKAIIYCRVSSQRQVNEGHGLESQEKRCKDFAKSKNYSIDKIFHDKGISGAIFARSAVTEMIDYLTLKQGPFVVLFDDISRLARSVDTHRLLIKALKDTGAEIYCLNMKIGGDAPEDLLAETIVAATKEYSRLDNRRQVLQKMKARMELGYWVLCMPPGYKFIKDKIHGKILYRDEPKASIIAEALNGYANNRFITQSDVKTFLESKNFKAVSKSKKTHNATVKRLLQQHLYAGIIEYKKWGIDSRLGHHKPLISLSTFQKIQDKLAGKAKSFRQDKHKDFPLRGFILCKTCGKPMTASWSRSRNGNRHAYYRCNNKACKLRNKSIQRKQIETEFEKLLQQLTPQKQILNLMKVYCSRCI